MLKFTQSLNAYSSKNFNAVLKQELLNLDSSNLSLYKLTSQGGIVDDENINFSIYSSIENEKYICVKFAVFFDELVAGCSCGDPVFKINDNSEMFLKIDKSTASVTFN